MKKQNIKNLTYISIILLFIILIFSTIFAIFYSFNNRIIKGITINNISISGLTYQEVTNKFNELFNKLNNQKIILKYKESEKTLLLSELNINYDIDSAINTAYNFGRSNNILINNFTIINSFINNINLQITIDYDKNILKNKVEPLISSLPEALIESDYYIDNNHLVITKGKKGISIDYNELNKKLNSSINLLNSDCLIIDIPVYTTNPTDINIQNIHSEIFKEPKNAYITENPTIVHPDINGIDFDIDLNSFNNFLDSNTDEYYIPLKITTPNTTINDLAIEAFPNNLGSFMTRYDASNINRSNNIELASQKINQTIILPNEIFSFNKIVGKRTLDKGFKQAGAYASGKVIQEIGGGICQVSSTLYNAILYADLEIIERSNHYFETTYVAMGRDATVSWGTLDFKFKNNRKYPIKIISTAQNGVITINIMGIKELNENEIIIKSEITSIIHPNIEYIRNSNITPNTEHIIQLGHNGGTSTTYKLKRLNGSTVSSEIVSNDYYHPLNKIIEKN